MEDIQIIVSERLSKAVVAGLTERGKNWIRIIMDSHLEDTITISSEAVKDIEALIKADGLTVIIR